ncbi:MAG: amidohydrolase [candidate division Zixibacteria bacterium]|nr:amidohydrolase [candidate division Zixibacteria bacterium]
MINGMEIVDFHCHIGAWPQYGMFDDVDDMLRAMDATGVDQACVFDVFHGDHRRGNDEVARVTRAHPDRFIGFAFVTPHYPEEITDELNRAFDSLGMRAIKIYPPYFDRPVTDPAWASVFEFANHRRLTVISHTWGGDTKCDPMLFVTLAAQYPQVRWVMGHAGGPPTGRESAKRAALAHPSIFLEICSSFRNPGAIEDLIAAVGADRVVFGSDMPLFDPAIHVGRILLCNATQEEKRNMLGGNARSLLS